MFRVYTNNANPALSFNDLAFIAYFFDRTTYLHIDIIV